MNSIKIKDVAELADVSTGTVDRVLHNRKGVSIKTREKVLKIIDELGYKTNVIAQALATKKSTVFATLIPNEEKYSSYWAKPLIGIKRAEKGLSHYNIIVKNYFYDIYNVESFKEQASLIIEEAPKAVVIAPIFKKEALVFTSRLKQMDIPFIFLDSNIEEETNSISYIGQDSNQSGKVAAKLIQSRTIDTDTILLLNLTNNPNNQNHQNQRSKGFIDFFTDKNRVGAIVKMDITNLNKDFINEKLDLTFKNIPNLKAIFVTNSKIHIIAKYIYNNTLKDNVILIGYDLIDKNLEYLNNETIDYLISQDPVEQGYKSIMNLFQSVILNQKIKSKTCLPINIVIKENSMHF